MRILSLGLDEILNESKKMEGDTKQLKSELLRICWHMRGGVTLDEAYNMTYEDRQLVGDIVKDNIETTKKSGLPYF